jgi:hypothetical protein
MTKLRVLAVVLLALGAAACSDEEAKPAAGKPAAAATPAIPLMPMPESGFRVEWGRPGVPSPIEPGARFAVAVAATNRGDQVWLDPRNSDSSAYASGAVRLAYRWWDGQGKTLVKDYGPERGELLGPVGPNQTAILAVPVTAPSEPGSYKLQLELVQENVAFFQNIGAQVLMVPVTVKAATAPEKAKS